MLERRRTWYFVASGTRKGDFLNLLHIPYTAMVLGFVVSGAAISPRLDFGVLAAAVSAYFLGLGVGAHALDQLEPRGSRYVQKLTRPELKAMALAGLGGAIAIGFYCAFAVDLWLIVFVGAGTFFAVAYPLPSWIARGLFHNDLSFSFSWGFLPFITSYFAESGALSHLSLLGGAVAALAAGVEIRLSRRARAARKEGSTPDSYESLERKLRALVAITCLTAVALLGARFV